jgi:hypothetical protein
MHPDFGAGLWEGRAIGIPFDLVGAGAGGRPGELLLRRGERSGALPDPADAFVEGAPAAGLPGPAGGDRHVLVLETGGCVLYELFDAERQGDGSWTAGSGAVFDLRGYALRPDGWTSADAAGLPILPGLVRYDEVAAGEIRHALRFTAPRTRRAYVWPARHFASSLTDPALPPMGQRFRLRADADLSGFSDEALVIATRAAGLRHDPGRQRLGVVPVGRARRALGQRCAARPAAPARERLRGGRRERARGRPRLGAGGERRRERWRRPGAAS